MKKILYTLLLLLGTQQLAFAQHTFPQSQQQLYAEHEEGGRFFMGGALTFWNDTKAKSVTFDFCPEIGYLFNDRWGIGMMLGYEYEKETEDGIKHTASGLKVGPFARYYYLHRGPFNLYLDGGFALDWVKTKNHATHATHKDNGFEVGIRPGACVDLTEGLCLCLRMGFIGYRNSYTMGEEEKIGNHGFGLRFAPEELMIGLELEF